jgi:hypothetical protein
LDANPKSACRNTNIRRTAQNGDVNLVLTQDLKLFQTVERQRLKSRSGCSRLLSMASVGKLASQKQFVAKSSAVFTVSFPRIGFSFLALIQNAISDSACLVGLDREKTLVMGSRVGNFSRRNFDVSAQGESHPEVFSRTFRAEVE